MNEIEKSFAEEIKILCDNLYVISETDAPLKAIEWKKNTTISSEIVAEKLKQSAENPLQILSVDDFFQNKITIKDWHGEAEKATVARFLSLKNYLSAKLSEVVVYKTTNNPRAEIVIVGKNSEGFYAGLKTYVVET
jgi:Nuclease A inhibitor-like protein